MQQSHPYSLFTTATLLIIWVFLSGCKEELPRVKIPVPHSPQELQTGRRKFQLSAPRVASTATSVAGLRWTKPSTWKLGPKRSMRIATYYIPGAAGQGECSLFYFGPRAGGIQANIDRWRRQFTLPPGKSAADAVKTDRKNIGAVRVTMVEIQGSFQSKANMMMLGAIALGKKGPVFFKCVGPKATMLAARSSFQTMIYSIKQQ